MFRTKADHEQLPPMELAIMHVLWELGPSTVQEVQQLLDGSPAYTTVQTIMTTMEKKGRAKRTLQGKAFVYRAAIEREKALGHAVRDLVQRTFRGSVEDLLLNLVKSDQLDAATLKRIERRLRTEEKKA